MVNVRAPVPGVSHPDGESSSVFGYVGRSHPPVNRLTRATLGRHLKGLDRISLTNFVVDLWAARGYTTSVDGAVVVATRTDDRIRILPIAPSRLPRASELTERVDIVLAPAGGRHARRVAARADARILTTEDVRELLVFAVDEGEAETICRRYFGVGPTEMTPPPTQRAISWARAAVAPHAGRPLASILVGALILTSVMGIAITAGSPGPAQPTVGLATPDGTLSPDQEPNPAVAEVTPIAIEDRVRFPIEAPGVDRDGITNLSALAAAHDRELRDRSYTVWADVHRPRDGRPNASRIQRDIDMRVEGDRYRVTTTIVESSNRVRERILDLYADGETRYVAQRRGEVIDYRPLSANESPTLLPEPPLLREQLVETYLSTPETELVGLETVERRTYYRITGEGTPAGLPGVTEYRVVAMVDTEGIVRDLEATYIVTTEDGEYPVTVEIAYDNVFWTTVDPPSWYEPRFGENGTQRS